MPDVPTIAEAGVPGFASTSWQGWFVPAKTPPTIVRAHPARGRQGARPPDVRAAARAMAYEGVGEQPAEFDAYYKAEIAKFAKVIADAKIPQQ